MRVIKTRKYNGQGSCEYFLVWFEGTKKSTNEDINRFISKYCKEIENTDDDDFSFIEFESFVEDTKLINTVLKDKIRIINREISNLEHEKGELKKYLK